jgi:hypothetical protein
MIEVLELKFVPFSGTKEIGRISLERVEVGLYEAIRGGYYTTSPFSTESKVVGSQTNLVEEVPIPWWPDNTTKNQPLLDWLPVITAPFLERYHRKNPSAGIRTKFSEVSQSKLKHFTTIQFIQSMPSKPSEILKLLNNKDVCAVTRAASYDDLVNLALTRAKKMWSREFVQDLIKRIARGTDNGDFCGWNEARAVTYALKPELKGTLKKWDDWRDLPLETLFTPADFDQKDDVIIATVLKDKLLSVDAMREIYCVPGLFDTKRHFLHWSVSAPTSDKQPFPDWGIRLTDPVLQTWAVDYSGPEAQLQPAEGSTFNEVNGYLLANGLPEIKSLPYKIKWEEIDKGFCCAFPGKIETGLRIVSVASLPPVLDLAKVPALEDVPKTTIGHILSEFGRKSPSSDKKAAKAFCKLLEDVYPSFEEALNGAIGDRPLIRINDDDAVKTKSVSLSRHLFPEQRYEILVQYLLAFYMCMHMRGKAILDPEYVSELFTPKGIFDDLTRSGYPPPDASFASRRNKDAKGQHAAPDRLIFVCPYGEPEALDDSVLVPGGSTMYEEGDVDHEHGDLQVEGVDTLLEDFI